MFDLDIGQHTVDGGILLYIVSIFSEIWSINPTLLFFSINNWILKKTMISQNIQKRKGIETL